VVIDASFLLKLFLPEERSELVEKQWEIWIQKSVEVVAPTLIAFEASSVIRNKVYREILSEADGKDIIDRLKSLDLVLIHNEELLEIAWDIGSTLKAAVLYDCFYLALSKLLTTPLWTADAKLHGIAKDHFPLTNLI
jgi:predicted nucleic acid-binding protein